MIRHLSFSKFKLSTNSYDGANIQVGDTSVEVSSNIRSLGVTFNRTLSMQSHVNAITKVCFYYLGNIAKIRRLSDEECKIIVHACVIKRLDYCNVQTMQFV